MSLHIRIASAPAHVSPPLWWCPHDLYRYSYDEPKDRRYNPAGNGRVRATEIGPIPEVYNLEPGNETLIPPEFRELVCRLNPMLTREKAMALMGRDLAFTNKKEFVLDPPRVCGGAVVTGVPSSDKLWIDTIRLDKPCPNTQYVLESRWLWFWCVSVNNQGKVTYWNRMGSDGLLHHVRFPIMSKEPLFIRLDELLKLPPDFIPDAQWTP